MRFGGLSAKLNTDQAVFSETQQAVELLQQFSGFFVLTVFCLNLAMHHTRSYPAALFDLHSVFIGLGTLCCLPRSQRPGVTSPASIVSGDGYSVVKVPC